MPSQVQQPMRMTAATISVACCFQPSALLLPQVHLGAGPAVCMVECVHIGRLHSITPHAGLTSFGSIEAKEARLQGDVQDTIRLNERSYQVLPYSLMLQ